MRVISATLCCSRACATASLERSGRNWRNQGSCGRGEGRGRSQARCCRCRARGVRPGQGCAPRHEPVPSNRSPLAASCWPPVLWLSRPCVPRPAHQCAPLPPPPTAMMSASVGRAAGGMLKMRRSSATQSALTSPGSLASAASTSAGASSWIFFSLRAGGRGGWRVRMQW